MGANISGLNTANLLLETQIPDVVPTTGLVMSGDATISLVPGANTITSLSIKRVVAKVKLGSVTLDPGITGTFVLNNVYIMKAYSGSSYGPSTITPATPYYGGIIGTVSTDVKPFLAETITNAGESRFFYIFPNDNSSNNATLLTLGATYNGSVVYFPIRINDVVGTVGATTDASYVKRNMIYTLHVTIKRPDNGTTDPEAPLDPATLDITVAAANWDGDLVQNVEI